VLSEDISNIETSWILESNAHKLKGSYFSFSIMSLAFSACSPPLSSFALYHFLLWLHCSRVIATNKTLTCRVRSGLSCLGVKVLKGEISIKICSTEFPAVSTITLQLIAESAIQMLTAFHFSISTQDSINFHGGFTFQKLPYPIYGITVVRKLVSYVLVTHMSQLKQTFVTKYHVRFSLSR